MERSRVGNYKRTLGEKNRASAIITEPSDYFRAGYQSRIFKESSQPPPIHLPPVENKDRYGT